MELLSLVLFFLAVLSFILLIRDVFPFLDSEDQTLLSGFWIGTERFTVWRKRDRAIEHAWDEHVRRFPNSRKRLLFAVLLVALALSVMGYPLWKAFGVH